MQSKYIHFHINYNRTPQLAEEQVHLQMRKEFTDLETLQSPITTVRLQLLMDSPSLC